MSANIYMLKFTLNFRSSKPTLDNSYSLFTLHSVQCRASSTIPQCGALISAGRLVNSLVPNPKTDATAGA